MCVGVLLLDAMSKDLSVTFLKNVFWPGPFPLFLVYSFLGLPSLTPYNTSTSQLCHFNHEDGDSMFL
jgi:hypothetical protein